MQKCEEIYDDIAKGIKVKRFEKGEKSTEFVLNLDATQDTVKKLENK